MRRFLAVLCLSFGIFAALPPGRAAALEADPVAAARRAYASGDFAGAARAFEETAATRPALATVGLCLDAATAARLAGEPGRAAWWLCRAVLRAPGDAGARKALAAAGLDAGALFSGPWTPLGWLPARWWWDAALAANAVFWLALALGRRRARPVPRRPAAWAGGFVLCLWLAAGYASLVPLARPRGVTLAAVEAASAPEAGAEAVGRFAPGSLVALGPRRAGRLLVVGPDGLAGWVPRDAVATMVP
ncbi:hypothetical protein [Solidesulfovibrio sp.]|uniref:hypothetical protein n=1 Tax=Solidesulfovibrio sp. TaxID=2910990 RepID=UPI00260B9406|nr:hypothetical protein [Solidesulfovibrio sp.]